MSGTRGAYDPLRQTQREVDGQREANAPRNYDALRQTQQEVDARPQPTPVPQQTQDARSPHETFEERTAANSQDLDARVEQRLISQSEKIYRERQFDNQLVAEQKAYDEKKEKQAEALDRVAAIRANNGPDHQSEQQREMER